MEGDNVTLTEEQLAAQKQAEIEKAEAEKKVELSDEDFAALVEKRLGAKPSDLIKKSEQIKVLTEEEKRAAEEQEQSEALKFGLETNQISKKEYDSYLELKATNKIEIARKKFIAQNPELGDKAGKKFDKLMKLEEDDELEEGEKMVPNEDKAAAKIWAEKLADEEIEAQYGKKIKSLPEKYKSHLAQEALKKINATVIAKAITEIPKRLEVEVKGEKYGIDLTDEDFAEANTLVVNGALSKKDLTAEEVKETAATFLFARNASKLMEEAVTVAYDKGVADTERGAKGIKTKEDQSAQSSAAREFLKKHDIKV